jgi:hypothetical protein
MNRRSTLFVKTYDDDFQSRECGLYYDDNF